MRKGSLELTIGNLPKIILPLLLGLVLILLLTGPAKGKIGEIGSSLDDAIGNGWAWGCKDINKNGPDVGATDDAPTTVTFDEFMKSMERVYNACNELEHNCKSSRCETMILKDEGVLCYKVTNNVLEKKIEFTALNTGAGGDLNIYCKTPAESWSSAVEIYNKKTDIDPPSPQIGPIGNDKRYCININPINFEFPAGSPKTFTVSNGDEIKISAYRSGWTEESTDTYLKIEIDGNNNVAPDMSVCTDITAT